MHLAEFRSVAQPGPVGGRCAAVGGKTSSTLSSALTDEHGYDDIKFGDRAWRKAQDLVAIHETELSLLETEIVGTRTVVMNMFRLDQGTSGWARASIPGLAQPQRKRQAQPRNVQVHGAQADRGGRQDARAEGEMVGRAGPESPREICSASTTPTCSLPSRSRTSRWARCGTRQEPHTRWLPTRPSRAPPPRRSGRRSRSTGERVSTLRPAWMTTAAPVNAS
jgi:hypothetical protein